MSLTLGFLGALSQVPSSKIPRNPLTFSFNPIDYNGGIQNWNIAQNQDGFIYVANNFGLLEYDGESWNNYEVPNSTKTLSILITDDRTIYVGGQNEFGMFKYDSSGRLAYESISSLIDDPEQAVTNIWNIHEFNESIIFNSERGIYVYKGDLTFYPFEDTFGGTYMCDNKLFAFIDSEGMMEWNGTTFINVKNGDYFKNQVIVEILPAQNNGYLVFYNNGNIVNYNDGVITKWQNQANLLFEEGLINCASLLSNNQIAVGTQNSGLVILNSDGTLDSHIHKSNGLVGTSVLSIYEDQYNNLWLGMNNGISCVEYRSPFSLIDSPAGINGTGYHAFLHQDDVFLGTNTGLYRHNLNFANSSFELVKGSEGQVYSINKVNQDIYIGHHRGAMKLNDNSAKLFFDEFGTWKFMNFPYSDKIIMGTYEGLYQLDNTGLIKKYDGLAESSRIFEFENDSVLWMSHSYRGAYRIEFTSDLQEYKSVKLYTSQHGFPSELLINVFKVDGKLIFCAENGVFIYNPSTDLFENYESLEEILGADQHISYLKEDLKGNIYYIIDNNKFGVLQKKFQSQYHKFEIPFRRINSYFSDDLENISIINPTTILIGAKDGFVHYNPGIPFKVNEDFSTFIRSVEIRGRGARDSTKFLSNHNYSGETIPLSWEDNTVKFTFSAPYFDGLNHIMYQYQLVGFDKGWSDWTTDHVKEYTNLEPGVYTFKVQSKNTYDEIGEVGTFKFSIDPPWYKSNWAYSSYSASVLAVFILSLVWQSRKHQKEKTQLEEDKELQISAKDNQLKAISESKEKEIIKLRNEKLSSEIEHKNRELMNSTMHLMNKNEILLSIKHKIESVKSFRSENEKSFKGIIKLIETNLAEDDNWDHFVSHFDQVHEGFLYRLKDRHPGLTSQETRIASFLRMNLNSKDIAQLTNISVRSVEVSRYRLRKKLELERDVNLASYIMEL